MLGVDGAMPSYIKREAERIAEAQRQAEAEKRRIKEDFTLPFRINFIRIYRIVKRRTVDGHAIPRLQHTCVQFQAVYGQFNGLRFKVERVASIVDITRSDRTVRRRNGNYRTPHQKMRANGVIRIIATCNCTILAYRVVSIVTRGFLTELKSNALINDT